jgi:hypothetical protein
MPAALGLELDRFSGSPSFFRVVERRNIVDPVKSNAQPEAEAIG